MNVLDIWIHFNVIFHKRNQADFFFFSGNFGDFRKILNTLNVCSVKGVG